MTRSQTNMAVGIGIGAVALLAIAAAWVSTTQAETMVQGPTNLSPSNNATVTQDAFDNADWSDVEGTSTPITYRFESSLSSTTNPDGSFTAPLFQSGVLTESEIETSGTAEGTYFWHARAVDNMGSTSPWSATWRVVVDNDATSTDEFMAPTHVSPSNNSTITSAQWNISDWNEVSGTSTPITYRYEVSNSSSTDSDGSFTTPVFESGVLTNSQINTSGTAEGIYYWHVRAVGNNGVMSDWSSPWRVVIDNDATTTPPGDGDADELIDELMDLQDEYPDFYWQLQWLINDLADDDNGGSTPPSGSASIDNNGTTVQAGGHLDFVGRNFGRDETVNMTRNGTFVRTIQADGGGNFSTGSMSAPTTPGTYTYVFTGQTSGRTANSVITVQ
ncbi:hypothetical protein IT396_02495 [Candidatus Nomurabacteria bacterium]|nr:hypothetical protein [Candidatus Nomurabacteria bacterium]